MPKMNRRDDASSSSKKRKRDKKKSGPRLPSAFQREINVGGSDVPQRSESPEFEDDAYEYEEEIAQEESRKNRRFDPVDNLEPELPSDFKDEDITSDEDEEDTMPEEITDNNNKKKKQLSFSDVQGDLPRENIDAHAFLDALRGDPRYNIVRKNIEQAEKKAADDAVQPALSKAESDRLDRKAARQLTNKLVSRWDPIVRRNREAPTLYFQPDPSTRFPPVGAMITNFEPRTEFEKELDAIVNDPEFHEAQAKLHELAKLREEKKQTLVLNKVSTDRAKKRNYLSRQEEKAKRIKKIKSKTYRRLLKKEQKTPGDLHIDSKTAKEELMKQEFKRAEERMTLKHKNTSKWVKRALKRGSKAQDEGTRAAIAEQLHQNALLTRKMSSMNESNSEDEDSDIDEDVKSLVDHEDERATILKNAKAKTLKILEEEDEIPKSGIYAMPFMIKGMKRKEEELRAETQSILQEYDLSLTNLNSKEDQANGSSGKKSYGPTKKQCKKSKKMRKVDNSDSEEVEDVGRFIENGVPEKEVHIGKRVLEDDSLIGEEPIFESCDGLGEASASKARSPGAITIALSIPKKDKAHKSGADLSVDCFEIGDQDSDLEYDNEMVDGFLSSNPKPAVNGLPSKEDLDLLHNTFAGDDMEAEFEKDKLEAIKEENPVPDRTGPMPGWGQWTHLRWRYMSEEQRELIKKRREAIRKNQMEFQFKHVIISKKMRKMQNKAFAKTLPYPYTSKEAYEQSTRMAIGPDVNPVSSFNALTRPPVVKNTGYIIPPIKFEKVDSNDNWLHHPKPSKKRNY